MRTITWIPGSNNDLDNLYDSLREKQYNNKTHRLWKNYSKEQVHEASAFTIHFNNNDEPEVCSSIVKRNCWPDHTYRIMNRTWKQLNKKIRLKEISQSMGEIVKSQILWLEEHTDCKLYFISRQTDNWMDWAVENFYRQFNLKFTIGEHKYLTCTNEFDNSCWQHIIYSGDLQILNSWKYR